MKESGRKQGAISPCAACKLLRRRCGEDCVFAPYFPADEPHKFASVHKVFGASNVNKMLQELPEQHRSDAVSAMVYEANARVRDPVYGCVGAISSLQQQIDFLQTQLAIAQAEVVHLRNMPQFPSTTTTTTTPNLPTTSHSPDQKNNNYNIINNNGSSPSSPKHFASTNSQNTKSFLAVDKGESLWFC